MKLIFIHIYKCAGTTIRNTLAENYSILIDNHNSEVIYSQTKNYNYPTYSGEDIIFGHFLYNKWNFPNIPMITFLRHPIERLISQYLYDIDLFGKEFKHTKDGIIKYSEINKNLMTRFIGNKDKMDFIGITEKFDESIEIMKKKYNLQVSNNIINFNTRNSKERFTLTEPERKAIEEINKEDMVLYSEAYNKYF